MTRSAVSLIAGVHLQDNTSMDMIRDLNLRTYTILHPSAGLWAGIKAAVPDAVACLRMYEEGSDHATDWLDLNPEQEAGKAAAYVRQYGFGPDCIVTFGNEGNLPGETAGVQATYQQIRDWYSRLADAWNGPLGHPCRLGSMGFSPGHGEDQVDQPGGIGFEVCKPAFDKCDVIIVHEYWAGMEGGRIDAGLIDESGHWDNHFYAFRDAVTCRKWYPDKPVWVGEWNTGGWIDEPTLHEGYANCCDFFLRHTAAVAPWVEGATHFILDSFTQPYQIARVPVILDRFRAIGHEQDDSPPTPPVDPPPPVVVPPPLPPAGGLPVDPVTSALAAKYNLLLTPTDHIRIRLTEAPTGADGFAQMELRGFGPGFDLSIYNADPVNTQTGSGIVTLIMGPKSYYDPNAGQHGQWTITASNSTEHANVIGVGWTDHHNHINAEFYAVTEAPKPVTYEFVLGFADYAAEHPEVGAPTSQMLYPSIPNPPLEAAHNIAIQGTDKGIMVYTGVEVLFIPQDFAGELKNA